MKHKFDEAVQHEHNLEFDAQDVEDVLEKAQDVAVTVIVTYMVSDVLRHIFKKHIK